jgi:arylsulfatase
LEYGAARLFLQERLESADLRAEPLEAAEDLAEVLWVRAGLAGVVVELDPEDAAVKEDQGRILTRFELPLLPAPAEVAEDLPEILDLSIPRLDGPGDERTAGFWIENGRLSVLRPAARDLPDPLRLCYTIYAAQLAGSSHAAGRERRDLLGVRARRGNHSAEAIAIPSGAALTLTLPPLPEGAIEGALTSVRVNAEGLGPTVILRLDGEEIFETPVPGMAEGATFVGSASKPRVSIPGAPEARRLEIEVGGDPGNVVLFEAPAWARPRTWSDGHNVILIVVSSLRRDRLAVYGNDKGLTRNLDRLARQSLRYEEAWTTSSFGLTALASLVTSTFGRQHLAVGPERRLGDGLTTLAERFRQSGYQTAAFTEGGFASPPFGLDRGFLTFDAESGDLRECVDRARAFLERAGKGPWFVLLHTSELQLPYLPPKEAVQSIARRFPKAMAQEDADPLVLADRIQSASRVPPEVLPIVQALYDEEVRAADALLGEFLDAARAQELFDAAVISVTAEHGEELGEHGFIGHGDALYPEVLRIPWLLKLPFRDRENLVYNAPVSLIDLAPTLLHAAGLEPMIAGAGFVGTDLLAGNDPTPMYAERDDAEAGLLQALRHEDFLLIHGDYVLPRREKSPELYNLDKDPNARANTSRSARVELQKARGRLKQFEELHGAPLTEESAVALDAAQRAALERLR